MTSAHDIAIQAARSADVSVVEIHDPGEQRRVAELIGEVWQTGSDAIVSASMISAVSYIGGYVSAAFDGAAMVGAAFGLFASDGHLHSHLAGVAASHRGRGIGLALKTHQRAWALDRGIDLISWTFDPLVLRNASFNIGRLGAMPVDYLTNFYGAMDDGVNAGDDSDRLLVHWSVAAPSVTSILAGASPPDSAADTATGRPLVAVDVDGGRPAVHRAPNDADAVLVAVPPDIEAIRAADPGLARAWRLAVREAMTEAFRRGLAVTSVRRDGWYLFERHRARGAG